MSKQTNGTSEETKARQLYGTLDEAKTATPTNDKHRLYEVLKGGVTRGYVWTSGVDTAIVTGARADGYTARVAEPKGNGPLTAERAAAKLSELSDTELAALGLKRAGKGKK